MEQATRTLFPNYFNGSEIIIAGKLVDKKMDRLHVEVTASNSKKFVILKTDVPLGPQKAGNDVTGSARPRGDGEEDPNHLKRLWSYLTVKELLNSWLQSDDEQEKERLRQKAQTLAVSSRFLTPFTSMKLKESSLQMGKREDSHGMSAATGPGTVVQSLQGSSAQSGNRTPGPAVREPTEPLPVLGPASPPRGLFHPVILISSNPTCSISCSGSVFSCCVCFVTHCGSL